MIIEYPFYMAYKKLHAYYAHYKQRRKKKKEEILVTEKASSKRALVMTWTKLKQRTVPSCPSNVLSSSTSTSTPSITSLLYFSKQKHQHHKFTVFQ